MKRREGSEDFWRKILGDWYEASIIEQSKCYIEQKTDTGCQLRLYEDITKEDLDFLASCNVRWD